MTVVFYELSINMPITIHRNEKINIENNYTCIKITLNNDTSETIGYVVCINCNHTIDNNLIAILENIKINNVFF